MENISVVFAQFAPGTAPSADAPSQFFADPRFGGMGHRAILPVSQVPVASGELSDYHFWRVCCGVPEGPRDLKIDEVMPLHANLDLLEFISFSKGGRPKRGDAYQILRGLFQSFLRRKLWNTGTPIQ